MKYKSYDHMNCSLAQTLDIIGERWTLLILRDAFFGVKKFGKFQEHLGVAKNILASRLTRLVEEGIFEKITKTDGGHPDYVLTKKGLALQPILLSMTHWGDEYKPNPKGLRLQFIERKSETPIRRMAPTSEDGRSLSPREIMAVPGPGLING